MFLVVPKTQIFLTVLYQIDTDISTQFFSSEKFTYQNKKGRVYLPL